MRPNLSLDQVTCSKHQVGVAQLSRFPSRKRGGGGFNPHLLRFAPRSDAQEMSLFRFYPTGCRVCIHSFVFASDLSRYSGGGPCCCRIPMGEPTYRNGLHQGRYKFSRNSLKKRTSCSEFSNVARSSSILGIQRKESKMCPMKYQETYTSGPLEAHPFLRIPFLLWSLS